VRVVTTADSAPAPEAYPVTWVSRSLPGGVRHGLVAARVAAAAQDADVVYATSMIRRAVTGAGVARRPVVVKVVADEAYERARRSGRFEGTLEDFREWPGDRRTRALRATRTALVRRADHVIVPSAYLRGHVVAWGVPEERVSVIPNPAPPLPTLPSRDELRGALGIATGEVVLAFAGRLTAQKALPGLLEALAVTPGPMLLLLGEGPERDHLERRAGELGLGSRVRFLGGGRRDDVLRLFAAADVAVLPSAWENFPHTVVEALAVGTPVLATAVGGVPEVVVDGRNGLLVTPGSQAALAEALGRLAGDADLRARLAEAAAPSVAPLAEPVLLDRIVRHLEGAVGT
jgi:glycosyltransferase involved in cell wall biosynthesis